MKDIQLDSVFPKERLVFLCDGIFSITMTLMILDLKAPENIPRSLASEELPSALFNLLPSIEAYVLSFFILGIFWARHQLMFNFFESVDRVMIMLNLLFLLLIGFVPFAVSLKKDYPQVQFPFIIYVSNLIFISLLLSIQWEYALRKKIILKDELTPLLKKRFRYLSILPVVIFTTSFIVSFYHVRLAFLIIYLLPIFYVLSKRIVK
ncbi:MAG TPA: TMEM175 family protein [Ignavibacteria bacterium]|nr:TMEM175 family protein [Ignavibacteria bacterium]